jgi:hypothetical protein
VIYPSSEVIMTYHTPYKNVKTLISDLHKEMMDVTCNVDPWWPLAGSFGLNFVTGLPAGRLHRAYIKLRLRLHFRRTQARPFTIIEFSDRSVRLSARPADKPFFEQFSDPSLTTPSSL